MEKFSFTFKNNGNLENNDVVYPGPPFQLENYSYKFSILPRSKFWRWGIRFSKKESIEFFHPETRYNNEEFKNYKDLLLAVGERPEGNWQEPNRLSLAQYNFNESDPILNRNNNYVKYEQIDLYTGYNSNTNELDITLDTKENQWFKGKYILEKEYKFFKLFAWADGIDFEIDCLIEQIPMSDIAVPVKKKNGNVNTSRFDQVINTLIDGNEEQRANLLERIQDLNQDDRRLLSNRLRDEIQYSFNPDNEKTFATAVRDPQKIPSIRSWMLSALIWVDAENSSNRKVLIDHINPEIEPEENVRYWTLAGLFQKQVSYLDDAVVVGSLKKKGVVNLLALAINSYSDPQIIEKFRAILLSETSEESWEVLRILRIIAIPSLVPDVCDLLNRTTGISTIAYDAFYALANPYMAKEAVDILTVKPGIKNIVDRIIGILNGSNLNAARNFTRMLLPFGEKEVDLAIEEAYRNVETRIIANQIRNFLNVFRNNSLVTSRPSKAGYAPDAINVDDDRLNIKKDVQILTAVMLAKDVSPPLAIGLFGDWGSGKSFFMKSIRSEVEKIKKGVTNNPTSSFCEHVVQIDFNAWHYVDTNLWASLGSFIFEKLSSHVSPKVTTEEQQINFYSDKKSEELIVKSAQVEKENTKKLIDTKQEELRLLQLERQEKPVTLKDLQIEDIKNLLTKEQKNKLNKSLDQMGIPAALNNISDLNTTLSDINSVKGRVSALFLSILNSKNITATIALLIILLVGIPALAWGIHKYTSVDEIITKTAAFISEFVAASSVLIIVLKRALEKIKAGIIVVEETKSLIETALADKKKEPSSEEIILQEEIDRLNTKEQEAISRISAATIRLNQIEKQIQSLNEERSLHRFLTERISSDDYRKHLGLISTIRQDFESLTERLVSTKSMTNDKFRPVERIILYVDDLDRCPPDKVMEVLQAVHLLLAYPLFIVVVGVDPRWLIHSLGETYSAFKNSGDKFSTDPTLWQTTPQNFLEKIFQIPYTLRPMNSEGFGKLMRGLFTPAIPITSPVIISESNLENIQENKSTNNESTTEAQGKTGSFNNEKTDNRVSENNESTNMPQKFKGTSEIDDPTSFAINEESLIIKPWETRFAEDFFQLIPTPRAAKRFSNVYRILKASVLSDNLSRFEGSEELPGEFQVPMLLLAILTGIPTEASKFFPYLQDQCAKGDDLKEILKNDIILEDKLKYFPVLKEKVLSLISSKQFPTDPKLFVEWIPRVSRFSFELGRITQTT